MTYNQLIENVENLGDYPRKGDILEMIQSGRMDEAKALVRRLYQSSGVNAPEFSPGVCRVYDTKVSVIYRRLGDLLDDYTWALDRRNQ